MTGYLLRKLANRPFRLSLYESSERLGGKVLTSCFSRLPVSYEAGAAEFYDYSPIDEDPLKELVAELGLSISPMGGHSVFLCGQRYSTLEDVDVGLGAAARQGWLDFHERAWGRMSAREFYESDNSEFFGEALKGLAETERVRFDSERSQLGSPGLHAFLETLIHSDLAAEWEQTSVAYGLQNYLMNDPAYMRLYRIAGGNEGLISALTARLAARVRLDAHVEQIFATPHGPAMIRWRDRGTPREEAFDVVILALPVEPLSRLAFADDAVEAAMRRHVAHHDHPAHYLRVTLLIEGPTPRIPAGDDFLMLDAFGGSCLYVETNRDPAAEHGVLGLLVAGAAAAELADRADEALVAMTMAALPPGLVPADRRVLEARVHRWVGAVSAAPGGWIPLSPDRRHQPSAEHPHLFVVGDYLYDSTLNGVLDSAEYVAGWVVARHAPGQHQPNR